MKERKYMDDWVNEVRLDPATGREKRVPVYRGDWYALGGGDAKNHAALAAGGCAGFFVLLTGYFLADFPGAATLYVFLPAALGLFPWVYWVMGAFTVSRANAKKMTRLQKETGFGRVLRSAAACAIFSLAAALGDIVFLLFFGAPGREAAGLAVLLCVGGTAFFTACRFRAVYRHIVKTGEEKP